ncbi:MAG TPA: zinc-dependent alcohol dehydrogenase family protein [Syntrophobacteraceae bacterium]|nr:zinc-dependent alcohol dehydrogenase family protein [Syntrophobacteraceae bacterium]
MNAMVLKSCAPIETAPLERREVPDPVAGPGEIRVRVHTCGTCRTDLHVIEGELPPLDRPIIPGHQIVGTVDQPGPGTSRFRVGDRVGIAWLHHACGQCSFCRSDRENLCESSVFTGYHAPGGYAELVVVPEDFAYPIPSVFSDLEAAPLLCAGIIGYRSLRRSECRPGQTLALYGFGSSAHIVIQIALHWGCTVYVCTRNAGHRELALRLGAAWAGSRAEQMPTPADSAILFAPAGDLVPPALKQLKKGGTLALAGIYMTDVPSLGYEEHLFYEKNLRSVTANTRQDGLDLLEVAARIPIRPRTEVFPLAKANEALLRLKQDRLRGSGVLTILPEARQNR